MYIVFEELINMELSCLINGEYDLSMGAIFRNIKRQNPVLNFLENEYSVLVEDYALFT